MDPSGSGTSTLSRACNEIGASLGARLLAPGGGWDSTLDVSGLARAGSDTLCGLSGATREWEGEVAAPRAGMSRSSKSVLGLSVVLTVATVVGVHVKQRQDQQVGVT